MKTALIGLAACWLLAGSVRAAMEMPAAPPPGFSVAHALAIEPDYAAFTAMMAQAGVGGVFFGPAGASGGDLYKNLTIRRPMLYGVVAGKKLEAGLATLGKDATKKAPTNPALFLMRVVAGKKAQEFEVIVIVRPVLAKELYVPVTVHPGEVILMALPEITRTDGFQIYVLNPGIKG